LQPFVCIVFAEAKDTAKREIQVRQIYVCGDFQLLPYFI